MAGIAGSSVFPVLCRLSYSSFRCWRDSSPQPLIANVTRAFATPHTFYENFLSPEPPSLLSACQCCAPALAHTCRLLLPKPLRPRATPGENPGGTDVHGFKQGASTAGAPGPEVSANYTVPGDCTRGALGRNELGAFVTVARASRSRDPTALSSFRVGFYLRVSSALSRSVRIPRKREK